MAQSTERIINGKQYDIETAKCLGGWDNGYSHETDIEWYSANLYRKESGEYFLYVDGNDTDELQALYGKHYHDNLIYIPLAEKEAQEWAKCYLTERHILQIFGVACNDRKQIITWVCRDIKNRVNSLVHDKNYTIQDIIAAGVEALEKR